MSYRAEKNGEDIDIIIDGFEKGIADGPYEGLADVRNMNIISTPKEAAVNFSMAAVTLPPVVSALAFTCTASSDLITVASTTGYYAGMAVIINTISGGTGISATSGSNTYYVGNITSTTFKLYKDLGVITVLDVTGDGSGTLSTAQLANPYDSTKGSNSGGVVHSSTQIIEDNYILDSSGQVWMIGNGSHGYALNTLQFLGNTNRTTLSTTGSLGIAVFKNYLFVFIENKIDYISLSDINSSTGPNGNWHIGWQTITSIFTGHKAISATDDACYFCNASTVGSILQNAGSTFDPATSSTYTYNASALSLPTYDYATCLAQLGVTLLVGGVQTYIYPWDRVSTSFNYPIIVPEGPVHNIVSTNSIGYIFSGKRGRIYMTNGANMQLYKKFPDQISNTENPYYSWGDAFYFRNQLYFSISATNNAGTAISNFAGVWAIDLNTDALRLENSLSYASYAGTVPVLLPMGNTNPLGNGYYAGWVNSTGGIDYSASSPYANYEAYVDTDIIPIGTYYDPVTDQQIEYKLSKPLVSGEAIDFYWRGDLTSSFTLIPKDSGSHTFTTTGQISDAVQVNFQKQQWVQLRVKLSSTASLPSYCRLRELRMR